MALALPTGAKLQQALFIFFYCVQAETKKKINYLFFFTLYFFLLGVTRA